MDSINIQMNSMGLSNATARMHLIIFTKILFLNLCTYLREFFEITILYFLQLLSRCCASLLGVERDVEFKWQY